MYILLFPLFSLRMCFVETEYPKIVFYFLLMANYLLLPLTFPFALMFRLGYPLLFHFKTYIDYYCLGTLLSKR